MFGAQSASSTINVLSNATLFMNSGSDRNATLYLERRNDRGKLWPTADG
jgi:hypothetical protein